MIHQVKSNSWCYAAFSRALFCAILLLASIPNVSAEDEVWDPLEGFNRGVFWFNDKVDVYIFEPIAIGYDFIVPDLLQDGVNNVFDNLRYPQYLLSDVVQLKFGQAAEHTGRFLINSTLGVAGIFDVAQYFGLEEHYEDFGTALGYHGVSGGPYLVLPLLGPSNLRDLLGRGVDTVASPLFWYGQADAHDRTQNSIVYGAAGTLFVQTRADLLDAIDSAKKASVDYYSFAKSAYSQRRRAYIDDKGVGKPRSAAEMLEDEDDAFEDELDEDELEDGELGE